MLHERHRYSELVSLSLVPSPLGWRVWRIPVAIISFPDPQKLGWRVYSTPLFECLGTRLGYGMPC